MTSHDVAELLVQMLDANDYVFKAEILSDEPNTVAVEMNDGAAFFIEVTDA